VNDTCDLESALLLFLAVHDHIPCGNPTCCPPPKEPPMTDHDPVSEQYEPDVIDPWLVIKIAVALLIAGGFLVFCGLVGFGVLG
jgi:hypothetical protein